MAHRPQGPLILDVEETQLPDAPSPAEAPQLQDTPAATARMVAVVARSNWGLGRWLVSVIGALLMLWIGVAAAGFVSTLFTQYGWLGWVGTGLLATLGILLIVVTLREVAALARLGRVEDLRKRAETAHATAANTDADAVLRGLDRLYRGRADLEWARESFAKAEADTPDATGRLALAERLLIAPLDSAAEAAVTRAARNVAAATALIPLALVDVLAALTGNLRMIREIAEIYGGRAGWFGSWRLMKAVAAHLVATGAVAVADDLLGPLVGGGILAKLSRRFGEGAVNGALTARIGVTAMDVCRPLPFVERERPKSSVLILSALSNWRRPTTE